MFVYKIYRVHGNGEADYAALNFEEKYKGREVSEVAEELLKGKRSAVYDDGDEVYFKIQFLMETTDSLAFHALRNTEDYDDSKHERNYIQGEIL